MIDWRAASALRQAFKRHLPFSYHRLNALARAVLAVCQWRTVNLVSLAAVLNPRVKTSSNDTRLQRLIHALPFDKTDQAAIAHAITALLDLPERWILTLDGTAVPLFWKALDKTGNSNTQERKHLLQRFLDTFGAGRIHHLLADREFLGQDGLAWLAH
ncbi:MAG: transposase, partial [Candidatus Competibacterales bacterium]